MFITNSPAPSRINSAELPQRDVTVWEFAIFGYFPCIIRTVRTRSFNHKHKHRKMAIFCYFFSRFFLFLELGIFLFKLGKKTYFLALGTRPNIGRQNGPKKTLDCDSFTILGLRVLELVVSHINGSNCKLFFMKSLQYHCIHAIPLHPGTGLNKNFASQRKNMSQRCRMSR